MLDVVDAAVVAENRPGARILQGIAHVAGVPVDEVVFASVRLVRADHDVAPFGGRRVPVAFLLREEFVNGGEDHAAYFHRQQFAEVCARVRLYGRLA